MAVNLDIRNIESSAAVEMYISATLGENTPLRGQWEEIFSSTRDIISSKKAYILEERVFGTPQAMEIAAEIRSNVYGEIDDGVKPSFLVGKEDVRYPVAGVGVHAVISNSAPEIINLEGVPCGRILHINDLAYLTLSGITADVETNATGQALAMLEKGESILKEYGADFHSVARTWMWLKDILSWYDDFNQVRNKFFKDRDLISQGAQALMPASTGIGLGPVSGQWCSMDLAAVIKPVDSIEYLRTTGKQHCAYDYGSAFSRATRAVTPAGKTIFVSGTASIGSDGETTNIGDAGAQIEATISNVRAVLKQLDCGDDDVVQAMAYCKTPEIEKLFHEKWGDLSWPFLIAVADVCRDNLLFEIEATAALSG